MSIRSLIMILLALVLLSGTAAASDTTFSYQGELHENGGLANGTFSMDFSLWSALVGGQQVGSTLSIPNVGVTDGKFTVELDFGADAFDNDDRWLEITVNASILTPRQPVNRSPYAIQTRGIQVDADENVAMGVTPSSTRLRVWKLDGPGDAIEAISDTGHGLVAFTNTNGVPAIFASTTPPDGIAMIARGGPTNSNYAYLGGENYAVRGTVSDPNAWAGLFGGKGYFGGPLYVGRDTAITEADYFHVAAPAGNGDYGGMYIDTQDSGGWPFYGYATGGLARMWTYYDGGTGDWHVFNFGRRLTVESSGQVGINNLDPAFTLEVNGSAGKPGGGSWSNSSDRRLKKNIRDLDGALEALLALRGVTFEYRNPQIINELPGERIGMIAQEVEPIFPDWVERREDGYRTLTFRGFEALTVEALRELRLEKDAEIAALRERIAQLESLVHQLAASPAGGRK